MWPASISRPSRHAQVMAIWGMGIMIGPILGPILGGWLTETANWRWVFFVNLPVGIASLAILIAYLPKRPRRQRRADRRHGTRQPDPPAARHRTCRVS